METGFGKILKMNHGKEKKKERKMANLVPTGQSRG
jgi:hypothetical protein